MSLWVVFFLVSLVSFLGFFFSFLIGKEYLCKDLYFLYRGVFCTVQMRILEKQRFLLIQSHAVGSSELENPKQYCLLL